MAIIHQHSVFFTLLTLHCLILRHVSFASSPPLFPKQALPTKSGYLPVGSATSSAMFYSFYEARTPRAPLSQTPLLIWLQGGPGCSSMIGNFLELGPWRVTPRGDALHPNPGAWNRLFGLLFIDNPIGTGFSVAASKEEIPRNQRQVAEHLYTVISEFIRSNPGFGRRPVYITGESYAGKYVPAIAYYILKEKPKGSVNLKGVAIGNGLTDPEIQVGSHAVSAYYSGLINEKQKQDLEKAQSETIELVRMKKWREATDARSKVLRTLQNMTGLATLYDITRKAPYNTKSVAELLNKKEAKSALGANGTLRFEDCGDVVAAALHEDVMKSVKFMVDYLVRETRVLLYQGQRDLRDGVVSTEAWVRTMTWRGLEGFLNAERKVWRDGDGELAGYVQKWMRLCHVVVMGAGHFVPTDQAINSQAMVENWVLERGLFGGDVDNGAGKNSSFKGSL